MPSVFFYLSHRLNVSLQYYDVNLICHIFGLISGILVNAEKAAHQQLIMKEGRIPNQAESGSGGG